MARVVDLTARNKQGDGVASPHHTMSTDTRIPPKEVIDELARRFDGLTHSDGRLNFSAFRRRTGIPAPTVHRIYNGPPEWDIEVITAQRIMRTFNISEQEARGYKPLPWLTQPENPSVDELSETELRLIQDYRELSSEAQHEVAQFLSAKLTIERSQS